MITIVAVTFLTFVHIVSYFVSIFFTIVAVIIITNVYVIVY